MPITIAQPQLIMQPAATLGSANFFKILGFAYVEPLYGPPIIRIECLAANRTVGNPAAMPPIPDQYQIIRVWTEEINGTDLESLAATAVTGSLYTVSKNALYAYLQSKGIFPAGTAS